MGVTDTLEPVITRFPTVKRPDGHVPFRKKLYWTLGILVLYFTLTNVTLYGLSVGAGQGDLFGRFRSILGGAQGSILHLGIGPIVTASIVLQLLDGADLLGIDTNNPRGQAIYQGLQKWLVVIMSALTAAPMAFSNYLVPDPQIAGSLGIGTGVFGLSGLIFLQVLLGGILILYMDEIISKWGVGSGVGLFIIAGISQRLIGGLFDWHTSSTPALVTGGSQPTGILFRWYNILTGNADLNFALTSAEGLQYLLLDAGILFIFTTILIFAIVVYAESVRVEIPLSHSRVKGARGRYPVKLIYASVLPLIFVRAIQANIQMFGRIIASQGAPEWFAQYPAQGGSSATGGIMYYLQPIYSPGQWMWWLPNSQAQQFGISPLQILLRIGVDLLFLVGGGALFAIFWVETANMGPESVAKQIERSGMQIPGFRRNPGIIEKVMERYIPQITIIGGVILGVLAAAANLLGTIGGVSGTGLLLTISITHKLYEEIAEEQMMEMHPMMRKMFGSEA